MSQGKCDSCDKVFQVPNGTVQCRSIHCSDCKKASDRYDPALKDNTLPVQVKPNKICGKTVRCHSSKQQRKLGGITI